jgi:hypothetical protein
VQFYPYLSYIIHLAFLRYFNMYKITFEILFRNCLKVKLDSFFKYNNDIIQYYINMILFQYELHPLCLYKRIYSMTLAPHFFFTSKNNHLIISLFNHFFILVFSHFQRDESGVLTIVRINFLPLNVQPCPPPFFNSFLRGMRVGFWPLSE